MAHDDQDLIAVLKQVLTEHQQSNGALSTRHLPLPERQGFFARLFDRHGALKDRYALKQLALILDTQFRALEHEADAYVQIVEINQASKVRLHGHQILQEEAILKKGAQARSQILLFKMLQNFIEQVSDIDLDADSQKILITRIINICLSQEENSNGNK
jgi:hypothetical protein